MSNNSVEFKKHFLYHAANNERGRYLIKISVSEKIKYRKVEDDFKCRGVEDDSKQILIFLLSNSVFPNL